MLLKDFVMQSREELSRLYPSDEAGALVNQICTDILGVQRYTYIVNPACEVPDKKLQGALAAVERLMTYEPIQYVLGYADFCGERFNVSPAVLIPRPETEILCNIALDYARMLFRTRSAYGKEAKPVRILDLCTGSGVIAWTMALNVPNSHVVAADISAEALAVAQNQRPGGKKCPSPRFFQADIFDDEAMEKNLCGEEGFDLILSNPPYVLCSEKSAMRDNVLKYEPERALFVPDDDSMQFNRKIAEICEKYLNTDSLCLVEINEALGNAAREVFTGKGFKNVEIIKDVSDKNRIVSFHK